ncbi:MAG: hypothetical protein JNM94_15770 [Phycisphaerae bacterium]|nr:hypothetical protein [Phycisphaerae bacterium]
MRLVALAAVACAVDVAAGQGVRVRISQETAPGAGDFGAGIVGVINAFPLGASVEEFYQYGTPQPASFNGSAFASRSNTAHLFVAANDGKSGGSIRVGMVFDGLTDADFAGGRAETRVTAIVPDAGLSLDLADDPSDNSGDRYVVGSDGAFVASDQRWAPTVRTDGYVLGGLACGSVVHVAFTEFDDPESPPIGGLDTFLAMSSDGSTLPLALVADRRVQLEVLPPESCVGDLTCDGLVDNVDVATMLSFWGYSGISDIDGDGTTDSNDLSALLGDWGECP